MTRFDRIVYQSPELHVEELDLPIVLVEHMPSRRSGLGLHSTEDVEEMLDQVVQTWRLRASYPNATSTATGPVRGC